MCINIGTYVMQVVLLCHVMERTNVLLRYVLLCPSVLSLYVWILYPCNLHLSLRFTCVYILYIYILYVAIL